MSGKNPSTPKAVWNYELVKVFCTICVEQIREGRRPGSHLSPYGWMIVVRKFTEQTYKAYDRLQLKNKWDQLKKDWRIWKQLKQGSTAMGWDPLKNTVDASEEWWEEKLKIVPNAMKFRRKGIQPEIESMLDEMFSGNAAMRPRLLRAGLGKLPSSTLKEEIGSTNTGAYEAPKAVDSPTTPEKSRKRNEHDSSTCCSAIACHPRLKSHTSTQVPVATYSVYDALSELRSMPDLPRMSNLYFFAMDLILDEGKRIIFMGLEPTERLSWLQYQQKMVNSDAG